MKPLLTILPSGSKFPDNPEATYAFQKVSVAYNVLSNPASKRIYDSHPASHEFSCNTPGATMRAEETLRSVVVGIFNDFLDGDLEMVRTLLRKSPRAGFVGRVNDKARLSRGN
jgi:DnaJ-class molecular chaperone